eukprot:COSAG01_NODE_54525_length_331_cov_1.288793_1_plen_85_part_01
MCRLYDGICDIDVDECRSNPCVNGATCMESTNSNVSTHQYRCLCTPGFTDGLCQYDFILNYRANCSMYTGGTCGIAVDECISGPC